MRKKFLLVEDEPMIILLLEDFLDMLDCDVSCMAHSLDEGLAAVQAGGFDAAILDINIAGQKVWPVADALSESAIPFALASGDATVDLPPSCQGCAIIQKPYNLESVRQIVEAIIV